MSFSEEEIPDLNDTLPLPDFEKLFFESVNENARWDRILHDVCGPCCRVVDVPSIKAHILYRHMDKLLTETSRKDVMESYLKKVGEQEGDMYYIACLLFVDYDPMARLQMDKKYQEMFACHVMNKDDDGHSDNLYNICFN